MKCFGTSTRIKSRHPLLWGIALGALFQGSASAQQTNQRAGNAQQKIESLKADFLTQQLKLSPGEAEKFWPVYHQYQQQMDQLARQRRENQISRNQMDHPSDAEIDQSLDRDFKLQQQALQLREQYRRKFRQVIPSQKVMQFYKSEKDFNMKLVRELRRRGDNESTPSPARIRSNTDAPVRSEPRRNQPRPQPRSQPRSRPVRSTPVRSTGPGRGGAAVHSHNTQVRGR